MFWMGLCSPHMCQQPMCHPGAPHPVLLWSLTQHRSQAGSTQLSPHKTWEQLKEFASCQNKGLNHCRGWERLAPTLSFMLLALVVLSFSRNVGS